MRAAHRVWEEVAEIVAAGGVPRVNLPPATRIVNPPRMVGRPRINPEGDRFAGWKMRTPAGYPRRCRNFSCGRALRKDQIDLCCSSACRDDLRYFCEAVLAVLDGRMSAADFPFYRWARSSRRRRPKRS